MGTGPRQGKTDREGEEIPDRIYNQTDFDRTLVIDDRTKLVAKRVTEFLKESGDRFQKTILFCVDQEHAARMRQALVNENSDLASREPPLRHADHRQRPRRAGPARQLHRSRSRPIRSSSRRHGSCPPASMRRRAG